VKLTIFEGGATMFGRPKYGTAGRRAAAIIAFAVLLSGCASANKNLTVPSSTTAASASSNTSGGMAGMHMGSGSGSSAGSVSVNGVRAVPTQLLGSAVWQGMKISVEATTPLPFVIYNGTSEQMVKAGPKTSFHLMVMLSDDQTGVAIPYASVWATISQKGKTYYDARQWPMISRYMGPHYGNDVSVPGAGDYQMSLLVSPPVSARHVEYQNVWLHPHRVSFTFHWSPPA
jgi:Fe2+ transport protein